MKHETVAITVSKWYLNPKMWAVKDMSVYLSADGIRHWGVRTPLILYTDHGKAMAYAMHRAYKLDVIYVSNINNRDCLTPANIARLQTYKLLKL
ncbi:MAG: hypothetical protein FVQ79_11650 [Planctomycetes bacterium]|nr:hypothetical protein [Planctomycetota bacterium]